MQVSDAATKISPPRPTSRSRWGSPLRWVLLVLLLSLAVFLLWPAPYDTIPFQAAPALPPTGALAPNDALRDPSRAELVGEGQIWYPEDVTFDEEGRMYVGNRDQPNQAVGVAGVNARITRVTFAPDGTHSLEDWVALPGGGPLDMRFDGAGNLIVASWGQGLIAISPDRNVRILVSDGQMIEGEPFGYADGVSIAADGKIYFTQGTVDALAEEDTGVRNFLENRGPGRLLVYDPATREVRTLIPNLSFGNGVVIAPDQSYVLVADQFRYQIKRYWLTGPNAGTEDIFLNNLPGFPHNLSLDEQQRLWIALAQPRNTLGDFARQNAFLGQQFAKILSLIPGFGDARNESREATLRGVGSVVAVDLAGTPILSLQNPPRSMNTLSTAVYHQGYVYIGTIGGGPVLRYRLD